MDERRIPHDKGREEVIRPHLMSGSVRTGIRLQRKHIRYAMGHLRPIICPTENQYTPQIAVRLTDDGRLIRRCRVCRQSFTRAESRLARKMRTR